MKKPAPRTEHLRRALAQEAARVMALEANFCRVQLDQPGPGGIEHLLCVRRTRLGKTGQQIPHPVGAELLPFGDTSRVVRIVGLLVVHEDQRLIVTALVGAGQSHQFEWLDPARLLLQLGEAFPLAS